MPQASHSNSIRPRSRRASSKQSKRLLMPKFSKGPNENSPKMQTNSTVLLKIIMLGDSGVGKTSLLHQFINKKYSPKYKATIGADFMAKNLMIGDQDVIMQIWDTAGQERFQSLGTAFYRGADACILVYDVTRPQSLKSLEMWKDEFLITASPRHPDTFPFAIVGNKVDLVDPDLFDRRRPRLWFDRIKSAEHCLSSAKSDINISRAFRFVAQQCLQRDDSSGSSLDISEGVKLNSYQDLEAKSQKCFVC